MSSAKSQDEQLGEAGLWMERISCRLGDPLNLERTSFFLFFPSQNTWNHSHLQETAKCIFQDDAMKTFMDFLIFYIWRWTFLWQIAYAVRATGENNES